MIKPKDRKVQERRKKLVESLMGIPYKSFTEMPEGKQEDIIDDLKREAQKSQSILPNREEKLS